MIIQYQCTIRFLIASLFLFITVASSQELQLVYKFKTGEVNRFKETTKNEMTSEMMPEGGQKIYNEMFTAQKTEKINADGTVELIHTIDSVKTTLNGQSFSNPQTTALIGLPLRITEATTGRVLDVEPVNDSVDSIIKQSIDILRKQLMAQTGYPPKKIKINETWQDSIKFSQDTQMGALTTEIRYSTTLTGSDTVSQSLVKVMTRVVDISGEIEGGNGTLKGSGKGSIYFSEILGKEIKSTMDMDQTMNMNTPQGPFAMKMKISTSRELLK